MVEAAADARCLNAQHSERVRAPLCSRHAGERRAGSLCEPLMTSAPRAQNSWNVFLVRPSSIICGNERAARARAGRNASHLGAIFVGVLPDFLAAGRHHPVECGHWLPHRRV
jgi:hypothetical protein